MQISSRYVTPGLPPKYSLLYVQRNVVILDNGCAVLRDFGIVNAIQENAKQTGFTTTSIGSEPQAITPYTSPEMLLEPGASPTLASDIWAWGCLLLEVSSE